MKTLVLFLSVSFATLTHVSAQEYKAKYISYKSDIKNEMEGFTMSNYKYENMRLIVAQGGKELLTKDSKDMVISKFFQKIPWNKQIKGYAYGVHADDVKKGEKISYYIQINVADDLKTLKFNMLTKNEITGKMIDDVLIVFNKIKLLKTLPKLCHLNARYYENRKISISK